MEVEQVVVPLFLVACIVGLAYFNYARPTWSDLPTLRAYLDKFPSCQTDHGIACRHCRSRSLRNWGWQSKQDSRRLFLCNHCGQILYRNDLDS